MLPIPDDWFLVPWSARTFAAAGRLTP